VVGQFDSNTSIFLEVSLTQVMFSVAILVLGL